MTGETIVPDLDLAGSEPRTAKWASLDVELEPEPADPATDSVYARAITWIALVASPLLLLWPVRAPLFGLPDMIDPFLHTALVQHGRDLIERFGTDRQFARVAFTVPGRLAYLGFGSVGGYYVLRYVLVLIAIVPAFRLFERLRGRAAGAVVVAAILANPVIVKSWSNDFPTVAAVSYLAGGCCCLVMPATAWARRGWVLAAGILLTLSLYAHVVTAPLVFGTLAAYAVGHWRGPYKPLLREAALLLAGFVGTTIVLTIGAKVLFGSADIFGPTFDAFSQVREDSIAATFHSTNWRWVLDTPHLAVPALAAVVWLALSLRRDNNFSLPERILCGILVLQVIAYTLLQFFFEQWPLEYYGYASMLWPATVIVSASAITEACRPLLRRPQTAWIPAAAVLAWPIVMTHFTPTPMSLGAAFLLIGLTTLAIYVVCRRPSIVGAVAALAVFVVVGYAITAGQPPFKPYREGQVALAKPFFGDFFGHNDSSERDRYALISEVHKIVPEPDEPGTRLLFWAPTTWSTTASIAASQYGWLPVVILGLPTLTADQIARIQAEQPDVVVLISDTGEEHAAGLEGIQQAFPGSTEVASETLERGDHTLVLTVVEIEQ